MVKKAKVTKFFPENSTLFLLFLFFHTNHCVTVLTNPKSLTNYLTYLNATTSKAHQQSSSRAMRDLDVYQVISGQELF